MPEGDIMKRRQAGPGKIRRPLQPPLTGYYHPLLLIKHFHDALDDAWFQQHGKVFQPA
jgi:hypothetical protein